MTPSKEGHAWILGFDIGGTKTAVVAGSATGLVFDRKVGTSGAAGGFESMWARMTEMADELIAEHGRPAAIGVSVAGPVDASRGVVQSPPISPAGTRSP